MSAEVDSYVAEQQTVEPTELAPQAFAYWNNLGWTLFVTGDVDGSIAARRAMVERFPKNATSHYSLGTVLSNSGAREEAIPHLKEAIRQGQSFPS